MCKFPKNWYYEIKNSKIVTPSLPVLVAVNFWLITILLQGCLSSSISQFNDRKNSTVTKAFSVESESKTQEKDSLTLSVAEIARLVTVRIFTEPGSGSGVVVRRQNQTYTVLTCEHVIAKSKGGKYSILSADGQVHQGRLKAVSQFKGFDLALLEFDSANNYPVVKLGNSNLLAVGTPVFSAGFANYQLIDKNTMEDTRKWGRKPFRLTTGKVMMILTEKSLPEGYRLGYTNEVEVGMSGGPILNSSGELVGINGRLKYPLQGIDVFTFTDGSKPPPEMFQQMESLSWAIPMTIFSQLAPDSFPTSSSPQKF